MQTFDSNGIRIAYIDEQTAENARQPPILLIHGFASHIEMNWRTTGWIDLLKQSGRRVIAYDNRGHGESEKLYDTNEYGAPIMAEDARRLLDHLKVEQVSLLGYSMGARIGAFLATRHPSRVTHIVFGGMGYNMVRGVGGAGPIANALEAPSIDDVQNPTAQTFRAFAEQTKSDLKALAACIRSSRDPITTEDFSSLKIPALVAVGSKDVIGGSAKALADLMPNGESFVIEGRDHMKAVADQTFKTAVLDFLDRHNG